MEKYASTLHINVTYNGKGIFGNDTLMTAYVCFGTSETAFIEQAKKAFEQALKACYKDESGKACIEVSETSSITCEIVRSRYYEVDYIDRNNDTIQLFECNEDGNFDYYTDKRTISRQAAKKDFLHYLEGMKEWSDYCRQTA